MQLKYLSFYGIRKFLAASSKIIGFYVQVFQLFRRFDRA